MGPSAASFNRRIKNRFDELKVRPAQQRDHAVVRQRSGWPGVAPIAVRLVDDKTG